MKIYALRDEQIRPLRDLAYLFYYETQKTFYIEIPEDIDPWDLPMILFNFAAKKQFTINAHWSLIWVRQRIVPADRQNLGEILRDNGLKEYDEHRLLLLGHGRCAQDSCYLSPVRQEDLPEEIVLRAATKINMVIPLQGSRIVVFHHDGQSRLCDIEKITHGGHADLAFQRLTVYHDQFCRVRVLAGGYGVGWDNGLSIDDRTLYNKGTSLSFSMDDLRSVLKTAIVDTQEAAQLLGCTRQYISQLIKEGKLSPLRQYERDTLFLLSDVRKLQKDA